VPIGVAEHERADPHPGHDRAQGRDQGAGLQHRMPHVDVRTGVGHEVVGDVDPVPPGVGAVPGHLEDRFV